MPLASVPADSLPVLRELPLCGIGDTLVCKEYG